MIQLKRPFLLLSPPGAYPDTPLFRSAFELAAGLQTAQADLNADLSTAGGLAAGTLQCVGRVPKRPQMFASRNGLSIQIRIMLIAIGMKQ